MNHVFRSTALRLVVAGAVANFFAGAILHAQAQSTKPASAVKHNQTTAEVRSVSQTISNEVPLVIAHRGASGYLPEHTQESTAFAHALGADYIEQDVVLSKDGVPVVMHDITLNSVTNVAEVFPGRDEDGKFYVFNFTWAELQQLEIRERAASGRFPASKGNFRIGTFEQHVELIQGLNESREHNAGMYVEIKKPGMHLSKGLDASAAVLEILTKHGFTDADDRIYLQCFEASEVRRIRTELKSKLPLIQLFLKTPTDSQLAEAAAVANGIGVKISTVVTGVEDDKPELTDLVRLAHEKVLLVHVWTLRDDALPKYAATTEDLIGFLVRDAGVDGIFTDHPDTLLSWRTKMHRQGKLNGPFHLLNSGK